ncbi:Kinesin protein KIF1A [Fasciola gigantica]|uniref:Kinesin protein KIF1A n=1 Tax=Fasciola gigantica TaxID=46835 RepID=A0A504YSL8_FASGI|nr:Kinesin protein KIF1A [Fasciola gigantica]
MFHPTASVTEPIDWNYAISELLDKQGVDLRKEMEVRLLEMEEQFRREKEQSDRLFQEQRRTSGQTIDDEPRNTQDDSALGFMKLQEYEDRIQCLQEQVDRQSMMSSNTQDDSALDYETTSECAWTEREFELAQWAFGKWRTHQFTSLRIRFQFTLLTDTPYSPLSLDLSQSRIQSPAVDKYSHCSCDHEHYIEHNECDDRYQTAEDRTPRPNRPVYANTVDTTYLTSRGLSLFRSSGQQELPRPREEEGPRKRTIVAIEVQDLTTGAKHYLSLDRFNCIRAMDTYEAAEQQSEVDGDQLDAADLIETDLVTPKPRLSRATGFDHLESNHFFSQATLTENQTTYESVLREQLGQTTGQIPKAIEPGKEFTFCVTVLQLYGVHPAFTDVFCQYQRFRTLVPPTLPISSPVPPTRFGTADLLNKYIPVPVDRLDEAPCQGVFLIHQGLQRRLAITLIHEPYPTGTEQLLCGTPNILFLDVHEVVVGRVRETPEWLDSDRNTRILSLSLLPARYFPQAGDDRVFFRFEAAWDSSLHASPLLNRVTPSGQRVYMTMSCYLDVDGCTRPVCLTKDLAMMVFPRESKLSVPSPRLTPNPTLALLRSLRSLWSSFCRVNELNRVTGVYDLQLRLLGHARYFPQAGDDRSYFDYTYEQFACSSSVAGPSPEIGPHSPVFLPFVLLHSTLHRNKSQSIYSPTQSSSNSQPNSGSAQSLRSLWSSFCRVNELNRVTGVYDLQLRLLWS